MPSKVTVARTQERAQLFCVGQLNCHQPLPRLITPASVAYSSIASVTTFLPDGAVHAEVVTAKSAGSVLTGSPLRVQYHFSGMTRPALALFSVGGRSTGAKNPPQLVGGATIVRSAAALRFLRHRMAGRLAGAPARLHWELQVDDELHLPPSSLLHLLRIIQEAVNNALKHAQSRNIHVSAVQSDGTLTVAVRDDGRGLPAQLAEGSGMRNMRNRAQRLGAELAIRDLHPGTEVVVVTRLGAPGRIPPAGQADQFAGR